MPCPPCLRGGVSAQLEAKTGQGRNLKRQPDGRQKCKREIQAQAALAREIEDVAVLIMRVVRHVDALSCCAQAVFSRLLAAVTSSFYASKRTSPRRAALYTAFAFACSPSPSKPNNLHPKRGACEQTYTAKAAGSMTHIGARGQGMHDQRVTVMRWRMHQHTQQPNERRRKICNPSSLALLASVPRGTQERTDLGRTR